MNQRKACGAPGALRGARRVREAVQGNGLVVRPEPRPGPTSPIEPVLLFFPFGTPAFGRLVGGFRKQLFAEVAASDLPGLIFTYVWAFDLPEDQAALEEYAAPFRDRDARILYLELEANQAERLRRNSGELRLREKPSKRDLAWSADNLRSMDAQYRLNSDGEFDGRDDYLHIDNTAMSPAAVADQAIEYFRLETAYGE